MGGTLPDDFITWLEILLGGESDLLMCNPDSGYNYGIYLQNALLQNGFTMEDVNKIKIWNSGYPKEPDLGYCTINNTVCIYINFNMTIQYSMKINNQ